MEVCKGRRRTVCNGSCRRGAWTRRCPLVLCGVAPPQARAGSRPPHRDPTIERFEVGHMESCLGGRALPV